MKPEIVTSLSSLGVVTVLACILTHHLLLQKNTRAMGLWVVAAWILAASNAIVLLRGFLEPRIIRDTTVLVSTAGYAVLFLGARRTAGLRSGIRFVAGYMILFVSSHWWLNSSDGRPVLRFLTNSTFWGYLSFASFCALRQGPATFWQSPCSPANTFLVHSLFHAAKIATAIVLVSQANPRVVVWMRTLGEIEETIFMVALFLGLLVAIVQNQNEELTKALRQVKTLSGLLPVCAWCKKIRDDSGYWKNVEEYLAAHADVRCTHSICAECAKKLLEDGENPKNNGEPE